MCRTSADLFKTAFDLLVSVTVFVGRFDMRMMQVRLKLCIIHQFVQNSCHSFNTLILLFIHLEILVIQDEYIYLLQLECIILLKYTISSFACIGGIILPSLK